MGNACYFVVQYLLSSYFLSKNLKVITNDVSDYIALLVRIAHIICNYLLFKTVILPIVQPFILREGCRLRVCDNRVLRIIFGPKREDVARSWRKLHNEEHRNLNASPNIIRVVIKSRRMRWTGHVAAMGEMRNA
jgi:hypothetical protein